MKLKNNGWGTTEMLLLSGGLLIALLIAVFFISKLYGSFSLSTGNKEYLDLESKLENAASLYIIRNNIEVDGELEVSLDTLRENNLISDFEDNLGKPCDGYVVVTKLDISNVYSARIKCQNYSTKSY